MKLLLAADPAEGSPAAPPADDAAPPAGRTVANGQHTEALNNLQTQLETERTAHVTTAGEKKKHEQRIAELLDEVHRLKTAQTETPAPWRYRPVKRNEKKEA